MGKVSLGLGLAVGYVLGAQAGRDRYEQIVQAATRFAGRPDVQQALGKARDAAPAPLRPGIEKLAQGASGGGGAPDTTGASGTTGTTSAPGTAAPDAGATPGPDAPLPDPLVPPSRST